METFTITDLFFIVTGSAVIAWTIILFVLGYYLIQAAREVRLLTRMVRREVDDIAEDIDELRVKLVSRAFFVTKFIEVLTSAKFFRNVFRREGEPREKLSYEEESEDDE